MKTGRKPIILLVCLAILLTGTLALGEVSQAPAIDAPYPEKVTITAVRGLSPTLTFESGEDITNNIWIDGYLEDLNIELKYLWTVPVDQYDQKLNLAIVSQDLPDIIVANKQKQFVDLVENELAYDLTDLYEDYASDTIKQLHLEAEESFRTVFVKDRMMAIPNCESPYNQLGMIWIRQDWLDALNLAIPSTSQELMAIAEAFAKNDPDGNGLDDTFGFSFEKYGTSTTNKINSFFYGYHAYPEIWVERDDEIVYGSVQPEMKDGLLALQELYAQGLLDREFNTKDTTQLTEVVASGKVGIVYDSMAAPLRALLDAVRNFPGADWAAVPYVSFDEQPALAVTKNSVSEYYVVNKDSEHPEAILKLLQYQQDVMADPERMDLFNGSNTPHTKYSYALARMESPLKNVNQHLHITEAVDTGNDAVLTTQEEIINAGETRLYLDTKDPAGWATYKIVYGPQSSFGVIGQYTNTKNILYDAFYGTLTDTMTTRKSTLSALEYEVFTKIIMGEDISSFDKFVENWTNMGGGDMTREVNEWAASMK